MKVLRTSAGDSECDCRLEKDKHNPVKTADTHNW